MSVPKYTTFYRPFLDCLADGRNHSFKEISEYIASALQLTKEDMAETVASGELRYITRTGWGRAALIKAGLIEKVESGVIRITTEGQKVLAENPPAIDNTFLCRYEGYRKYQYPTKEEQEEQKALKEKNSVPETNVFRKAFLDVLSDGEEHNKQDISTSIIKALSISELAQQQTTSKGDRFRVPTRITWARRALKYAGLIIYPHKNTCKITVKGKAVLKKCPDSLSNEYLDSLKDNAELKEQTKAEVQKQVSENLQKGNMETVVKKIENKYTVTSYPVESILNYIKSGDIAIPEIQRPFVWKPIQVRDLIDSLYNCYPTGYLIIWQNPNVRLKNGESAVGKKVLIDGQQRVTALMAAVAGYPVLTDDYKKKRIKIAFNPVATDESERFAVQTPLHLNDPKWISDISTVFATGFSTMAFILDYKARNPEVNVLEVEQALKNLDAIKKCMLGVILLVPELGINEVTDIFVRINSKGKPLNASDFAMSKIAADEKHGGIMLRKAIDYFCRLMVDPAFYSQIANSDVEFMQSEYESKLRWVKDNSDSIYSPDYGDMLRVSFMHVFDRGKLGDLVSLLSGRDFEQRDFKESIAEDSFNKLTDGVENFMNQYNFQQFIIAITTAGFIDEKLLNSKMSLDFAYTLYLLLQKDKNVDKTMIKRYVQKWFVFTTLTGRYTGSPESTMDRDLRSIASKGFKSFLEDNEAAVLSDTFWEVQLVQDLEKQSANSPHYNTFIAAQIYNGDKSLLSSGTTVSSLVSVMGDIHHIFPKDYLRKNGVVDKARYNQIANYVFLDTPVNIAISNNPPDVYFGKALNDCGKPSDEQRIGPFANAEKFYKNLEANCIPREILRMDVNDYEKFLLLRRKMMAKKIRNYYEKL